MVNSTIDVTLWLDMIKKKSPTAEMIIRARQNPDMYDDIKRSIPCVTYNFKYNGYCSGRRKLDNKIQMLKFRLKAGMDYTRMFHKPLFNIWLWGS